MGRRRKADVDAVVLLSCGTHHATIVGYSADKNPPKYRAIMSDGVGRYPQGPVFWLDSSNFEPTGRVSRAPGRTYRKIQRHFISDEHRKCQCACCPHDSWEPEDDLAA